MAPPDCDEGGVMRCATSAPGNGRLESVAELGEVTSMKAGLNGVFIMHRDALLRTG